jgi:hypothetical protein
MSPIGALLLQFLAQLAKILDDAIVHDGEALGCMGVRIAFGRTAVSGPAGVPDPDPSFQRLLGETRFQIA